MGNGFQAIGLAALKGHSALCQVLLDKKADVNAKDEDGETPLMKASAKGCLEVVKFLLGVGADPDAVDRNDMSAIKKAARWGHTECMMELLPKVKDDPRQLKHCLLFGKLNGHEGVIAAMTEILEPKPVGSLSRVARRNCAPHMPRGRLHAEPLSCIELRRLAPACA